MSAKRKSVAMLDTSSDSDSDLSDSEFQKIVKKRKKSPEAKRSVSRSVSKSISRSRSSSKSRSSSSRHGSGREENSDEEGEGLNRSSDIEDGQVSDSDSDVGEFDDGLDDELMGDEEDRARLEEMNEKEREEEIFKRAEKREMMKKRYEIEKKLKLQKKNSKEEMNKNVNKALDTKERSRNRREAVENKKDKKSMALDVLKAKRKKQQEQQQKIEEKKKKDEETEQKKWKTNDIYSSDSSDDEIERPKSRSPERRRSRSSSSSSSASSSSVSSRSRSPSPARRQNIKSHDDLEKMRLTRSKLERWCHLPLFDNVVIGCFVRLLIGQNGDKTVYRVAEVIGVQEGNKIYNLGKTRTNKTLKLRYAHQERPFRMEFVSQQPFTDSEFTKWREDTMMAGINIPSIQDAEEKKRQIEKFNTRILNDKDIQHMLEQKKRFKQNPQNYAMYKSKLTKDRAHAVADGNYEESDRLDALLLELEEKAEQLDQVRTQSVSTIALINDRNRKNNIAKAEEDIRMTIAMKEKAGEVSDPFTRRKTKPTLATAVIAKKLHQIATGEEIKAPERNITKDTSVKAVVYRSKTDNKKENKPETKAKDLFSAHDFDIDINLDTFTPNSAIKTNNTPIVNTQPDIGPKKSLNLSDYKKKRGLI